MPETSPTPKIEEELERFYASHKPETAFVADLRQQVLQAATQSSAQSTLRSSRILGVSRRAPAWSLVTLAILLLIVILIAAVGPQRVLAQVRGWLGYLPGIGYVENPAAIRVLAEPVQVERAGITLSLDQGAVDEAHTVLVYQADGLSVAASNSQGEGALTGSLASLLLPDGVVLRQSGGEMMGWGTGYRTRLVFPALPSGVDTATLLIPRLDTMPAGVAPEGWELPLRFEPAPADLKVMPVYQLAPTLPAMHAPASPASATASPNLNALSAATDSLVAEQHGIKISLDQFVDMPDGYLIQFALDFSQRPDLEWVELELFRGLSDANGAPIPVEASEPFSTSDGGDPRHGVVAVRTNSKAYPAPWQITIPSVRATQMTQATFDLDLGADPQPGKVWQLGRQVQVGGYSLTVISATLELREDHSYWLNFSLLPGPEMISANLNDPDNQSQSISGYGGGGLRGQPIATGFSYDYKPTGVRHLQVSSIVYELQGPWTLTWSPPTPEGELLPTPTSSPEACLNDASWARLKSETPASPPTSSQDRLLLETYTGQLMPQLSLVSPGSPPSPLTLGGWGDLSADASQVAFIASDGSTLFIADAATGEVRPVPNTGPADYSPLWSPDGQWLAFVRANSGVFIIHPDGVGLRQVADASAIASLVGWMPDSQRLVITALGSEGSRVRAIDLASGQTSDYFVIDNRKGGFAQLSPDGRRVSFSEVVFGMPSYGLYVANLDGSGKRPIAAMDTGFVIASTWSPDSRWLALSVMGSDPNQVNAHPVLVQVDTCQMVLLPELSGNVISWSQTAP